MIKDRNLHLNPGAAGKHGWHKMRTMLRLKLMVKIEKNLEVVELGIRFQLRD